MKVFTREDLNLQEAVFNKGMDSLKQQLELSNLNYEYKMVALSVAHYRGMIGDIKTFISMLTIIQNRNHDRIKKDIRSDKFASEKDDSGNFIYTGVGKSAGLKTYAILSKYASDEAIDWFYFVLKDMDKSMKEVKAIMLAKYNIDFTKDI